MEKYEKAVLEIDEFRNEIICASDGGGAVQTCTGIFSYCGNDNSCSSMWDDSL